MTEKKRFKIVWYDNGERFEDNKTGLSWLSSPMGRFHTLDKLNELAEENEQLKIQNELLSDELEQAKAVIDKRWSEYLEKKGE